MTATLYVGQGRIEIPPHWGTMWVDGEIIHLQFPSVEDIRAPGKPLLRIASHVIRFPADLQGMTSAEMVLYLRRDTMKKENEALLLAFAEIGNDLAAIFRLYKEILP
jgi:hypothetical protein